MRIMLPAIGWFLLFVLAGEAKALELLSFSPDASGARRVVSDHDVVVDDKMGIRRRRLLGSRAGSPGGTRLRWPQPREASRV